MPPHNPSTPSSPSTRPQPLSSRLSPPPSTATPFPHPRALQRAALLTYIPIFTACYLTSYILTLTYDITSESVWAKIQKNQKSWFHLFKEDVNGGGEKQQESGEGAGGEGTRPKWVEAIKLTGYTAPFTIFATAAAAPFVARTLIQRGWRMEAPLREIFASWVGRRSAHTVASAGVALTRSTAPSPPKRSAAPPPSQRK
ncbi:hypothetical protein HDV00_000774 [Rhizophlyctis rosea]|nr:hypothetical protein HDV00_000774 [Rhizophlyctis rosea]